MDNIAGLALVEFKTASQLEDEARAANTARQQAPIIQSLAAHVQKRWTAAQDAKRDIEDRLASNIRRRRGEYDPEKLAQIKQIGGSEMWVGITSVKCRAAAAWLRETLLGTGNERPWQLTETPVADLPPEVIEQLRQQMIMTLQQHAAMGIIDDPQQVQAQAAQLKEAMLKQAQEEARERVERAATKIEDQLTEGGWTHALSAFIDDIVTFPTAVLKGPVPRMRKQLQWVGNDIQPVEMLTLEWDRVDPFDVYPAPWAESIDDGYLIERHKLTREALQALIGVEGYDDDAIHSVLADFGTGSLRGHISADAVQADAEGRTRMDDAAQELVEAIQLWDNVPGSLLIEWGLPEAEIDDPFKSYPCEVWLIGDTVIRAVLNYDPLGRKPYYATSYEKVPGVFWGNAVVDLVRDPQDMANAAARALSNNMGVASGPQCVVNVSRLPPDEDITQLYPWKIWQTTYSDFTDNSDPIKFFQPQSNAQELLGVLDKFASLADEYSGIPKYMTGEHVAGAGRTSSGLSMLINNAAKGLKHVVANIDNDVITPLLERIYQYNLRYNPDPDLAGDVRVMARGAMSLVSREAAAVRRNEFLQLVLNSPVAQQIVGLPGAAELLRENARMLDVNSDRIVPSREEIQHQMHMLEQQQMLAAQQAQGGGAQPPGPPAPTLPDGSREGGRDSNTQSPRPNMK